MKTDNTLFASEPQTQKTAHKTTQKTNNPKPNFHGFTLVELIVVITILVILGTIGFMSLSGYSGNARDSSRISDLNNIAKALDITYQKTNSYPLPDNYFNITYSGGNVWHQGNVSEGVIAILSNGGGLKLSKKPTDPLTTSKEYTYSKLSYGYAYQIKANWEGESVSYNQELNNNNYAYNNNNNSVYNPINQAQASTGNPTITYVKGNYNGVVAKTQTGNLIYILAVPSIVTSTGVTYLSSIDMGAPANSLSGTLLIHGGSNTTGVTYNPKLIYSSGSLPKTQAEQILFASGIATAYSGTPLAIQSSIKPFTMALSSGDTTTLASLGGSAVVNWLGGVMGSQDTVVANGACGATTSVTDIEGNSYDTVSIGTQCWMKSNLRTTKKPDGGNITKGTATTGGFTFANNIPGNWYSCPPNSTNTGEDCTAPTLLTYGLLYQWSAAMNVPMGSAIDGVQGICPTAWHIPRDSEWKTLIESQASGGCEGVTTGGWYCPTSGSKLAGGDWTGSPAIIEGAGFNTAGLQIQPAGIRLTSDGYTARGSSALMLTSTANIGTGIPTREFSATNSSIGYSAIGFTMYGLSVRCIKD